jgi:hypothetical protein
MRTYSKSKRAISLPDVSARILLLSVFAAFALLSANVSADTANTDQQDEKTGQVAADDIPGVAALDEMEEAEEVNTNDPTA